MRKILLTILIVLSFAGIMSINYHGANKTIDNTNPLTDLMTDPDFDQADYLPNENDPNLYLITIYEWQYERLYFYIYTPLGKNFISYNVQISLRASATNQYRKYILTETAQALDGVIRKYTFSNENNNAIFFAEVRNERTYEITEIENQTSASSGAKSYAIGKTYTVTGFESKDTLDMSVKELEVITLNPHYDSYTTNVQNEFTEYNRPSITVINYIAFPIDKVRGDLIGIRLTWNELHWNKWRYLGEGPDAYLEYNPDKDNLVSVDINKVFYYTSSDKLDILNYHDDDNNDFKPYLNYLNLFYWFFPSAESINDLAVIQKLDPNDDTEDYIVSETVDYYNATKTNDNDVYIIRFALTNFIRWVSGQSPLQANNYDYIEMHQVDVLELTFLKDGISYTLGVAADPGDIIPDDPLPQPDFPAFPWGLGASGNPIQWLIDFFNWLVSQFGQVLSIIIIVLIVVAITFVLGIIIYSIIKIITALKNLFSKSNNKRS